MMPNCSLPAPSVYSTIMQTSHFLSYPVYLFTLVVLIRERSILFKKYKPYLIFHVLLNIASETYMAYFMLPVTYLPLPMYRTTGWLSDFGFSGLFQFYILSALIGSTVQSILEMFFYRFKVTVVQSPAKVYLKIVTVQVNTHRVLLAASVLVEALTFEDSLRAQYVKLDRLYRENSLLPPEITCYSCIIAVHEHWVFWTLSIIWCVQLFVAVTSAATVVIYVSKYLKTSEVTLSAEMIKWQRMLLISIFIQSTLHGTLIGIPIAVQIIATLVELRNDSFAQTLLILVTYHGFASTCSMIFFTKPVRDKMIPCSNNNARTQPAPQSSARSNTVN